MNFKFREARGINLEIDKVYAISLIYFFNVGHIIFTKRVSSDFNNIKCLSFHI